MTSRAVGKHCSDSSSDGNVCVEASKEGLQELFEICLKHTAETGNKAGQGVLFSLIGNTYQRLGDSKQAIHYHELRLKVAKELDDRNGEGGAYGNLGNAYYCLGDFKRSIYYHELCLQIAKELVCRAGEGSAYGNLGNSYQSLGDLKKAIHYHQLHSKVAKEEGDEVGEANAYGNLGNDYRVLGDFKKAIHYHELSLTFTRNRGDRAQEGSTCNDLGSDYHNLGDFEKAIYYHELCLKIAKEVGNTAEEGRANGNLGSDYHRLGDYEKALHYHELHLEIAKQLGSRAEEGTANGNLGKVYCSFGDFKKAIYYHKSCLEIAKEVGAKVGEGHAYGCLGNDYHNLGDFKKSIYYHNLQLEIAKELGIRNSEGAAYGNLGNSYLRLGDLKQAIHCHERFLQISKEIENKAGEGAAYDNLGNDYNSLGDFKKAKKYHELSAKIAKKVGNKPEEGIAYGNLGNDYHNLKNFQKAIHFHELSLKVSKEVGDRSSEGRAYGNLGNDYLSLGDFEKAIRHHESHLEISKEVGDRYQEGSAYSNLGNAYHALEDFKKSIHYYELQLKIAKEAGDVVREGVACHNVGRIFESQGSLLDALTFYQSSVKLLNGVRTRLHLEDEWKINMRHLYQNVYTRLWCVLLKQGKVIEGLSAVEQGRTQALTDLMEYHYGLTPSDNDFCTSDEAIVGKLSHIQSNAIFIALNNQQLVSWFIQRGEIVEIHTKEASDEYLSDATTFFQSLMKTALADIGVRAELKCEDRSLDEKEDENLENERSDHTHSRPGNLQSSSLRSLYGIILGPFADSIDGDEIIIVPEGPLWLVPYAALTDANSKYLSESFRIRVIPSLTSLKLISDCPADYHHKSGALLVGDPLVEGIILPNGRTLQQLPFAKEEVEMIGRILDNVPLTGTGATKDEVLKRLSSVALVHIAAHGRMETGEIALAPNPSRETKVPKEEDYLLKMSDVLKTKLRARLVVLSCCHSGRGEIKADGVVGIARAFLGAGARSVLVSLWAINDEATLEFMKSFYQNLLGGRSASEALNRAMKSMRESDELELGEVKHWAPFVLIGDDVTLELAAGGQ